MSKVVPPFGSGDRPRISFEEFAAETESDSMRQRVGNEFDTIIRQRRTIAVPPLTLVEWVGSGDKFGTLQPDPRRPVGARSYRLFVSDAKFPNYLIGEGFDKEKALTVAAASVTAYCAGLNFITGLKGRQKLHVHNGLRKQDAQLRYRAFWHPAAYNAAAGRVEAGIVAHRIAARVALNIAEIDEFDPVAPPPYPPHIAALADPLEEAKIREIYASATVFM